MIEVFLDNLFREKASLKAGNGKYIIIRATGHAGFGKRNTDVVCAGVSAIIQTAVAGITKVAGIKQKVKQKEGFLESTVNISKLKPESISKLLVIIDTMLAGLEEISKIHPDALEINFEKRG